MIYRGKRLVNWDPGRRRRWPMTKWRWKRSMASSTTFGTRWSPNADAGVTWRELAERGQGRRTTLRTRRRITVATTRPRRTGRLGSGDQPEGSACVCAGGLCPAPLVGRVIRSSKTTTSFFRHRCTRPGSRGKGPEGRVRDRVLKVTPAHDQNDYELGLRHGLEATT